MADEALLEVKNLHFSYDGKKAVLSDVGFRLAPGEIFVILGANGSGKSTLLNCISNTIAPTRGEVLLWGRRIESYPANELAKFLGYVPQISVPAFGDLRAPPVPGPGHRL